MLQAQRQARIEAARAAAEQRQRELYWQHYKKAEKGQADFIFLLYPQYRDIYYESKVVFSDWSDSNLDSTLLQWGFVKHNVAAVSRRGSINMFASAGLVNKNKDVDASFHLKRGQPFKYIMKIDEHAREMGQKVQNQSLDHYSSVVQLQALMVHYGLTDIKVSHRLGADVSGRYNGKRIALEYEHSAKTRSIDGLKLQFQRDCNEADIVKYIAPSDDVFKLSEALGAENVIRRGEAVLDFFNEL